MNAVVSFHRTMDDQLGEFWAVNMDPLLLQRLQVLLGRIVNDNLREIEIEQLPADFEQLYSLLQSGSLLEVKFNHDKVAFITTSDEVEFTYEKVYEMIGSARVLLGDKQLIEFLQVLGECMKRCPQLGE